MRDLIFVAQAFWTSDYLFSKLPPGPWCWQGEAPTSKQIRCAGSAGRAAKKNAQIRLRVLLRMWRLSAFCKDSIEDATTDLTARFNICHASGIGDYLHSNPPAGDGKAKPLPPTNSGVPAQPDVP